MTHIQETLFPSEWTCVTMGAGSIFLYYQLGDWGYRVTESASNPGLWFLTEDTDDHTAELGSGSLEEMQLKAEHLLLDRVGVLLSTKNITVNQHIAHIKERVRDEERMLWLRNNAVINNTRKNQRSNLLELTVNGTPGTDGNHETWLTRPEDSCVYCASQNEVTVLEDFTTNYADLMCIREIIDKEMNRFHSNATNR